jgi:hypothetical protein
MPASSDMLYVSNTGTNTITVYNHDAQGNTAPRWIIGGSKTGISSPGALAEDASGNLYVANNSFPYSRVPNAPSSPPAVLVFAHGAKGNVPPIRVLGGPATHILSINGMTVDQTTGKIFVSSSLPQTVVGEDPFEALIRFAPNSTGNAAPFAWGPIGESTQQLGQDSTGQNIITFQQHAQYVAYSTVETTMAKQFSTGQAPSVKYSVGNIDAIGTTDDPSTHSYLITGDMQLCANGQPKPYAGIIRLAENTNGYAMGPGGCDPTFGGSTVSPAPISVITSDTCGQQLALGYLRNIYVVHNKLSGGCTADAVYVYNHDASGAAVPLRVLSGAATLLSAPLGIYEGR